MKKFVLCINVAVSCLFMAVSGFKGCQEHLIHPDDVPFEVKSIKISPNSLKAGEEMTVRFEITSSKQVVSPKVKFSLNLLGINLEQKIFSLCDVQNTEKHETAILINDAFGFRLSNDVAHHSCSVSEFETVTGTFVHKLDTSIPAGVEANVNLQFLEGEDKFSCVEESFSVSQKSGYLTSRFGFSDEEVDFLFRNWVQQHQANLYLPKRSDNKHLLHTTSVLTERKDIFKRNLLKIAEHNAVGENSYSMGMNQFGHLTAEEFKRTFASGMRPELARRNKLRQNKVKFESSSLLYLPEEVNWVQKGGVTPVKNQGSCGSCWSFATTGAMEGAYFAKTGKLVSFSEQELVACDHTDLGCNGGAFDNAFQFIEAKHGLCTEESFPYTAGEGVRGFCNITCDAVEGSEVTQIVDVPHDEPSLLKAISQNPVAVAIEADEAAFQFYSSGVLTAPCSQQLDHGVLAVGYGSDNGVDYWLVKNSWGEMWGLQGYIKIQRGVQAEEGGECGILLGPSYPIL